VAYYNLDMIISIGYRVKSYRGVQFRIWATQILKEYLVKGFVMNDELLKRAGGGNYFDELLSRIRDIRSSEKIFYRKILEIYALSIDYDIQFLNPVFHIHRSMTFSLQFCKVKIQTYNISLKISKKSRRNCEVSNILTFKI